MVIPSVRILETRIGDTVYIVCENIGVESQSGGEGLLLPGFQVQRHLEGFVVVDEGTETLLAGGEGCAVTKLRARSLGLTLGLTLFWTFQRGIRP